jgi:hypothetical protein
VTVLCSSSGDAGATSPETATRRSLDAFFATSVVPSALVRCGFGDVDDPILRRRRRDELRMRQVARAGSRGGSDRRRLRSRSVRRQSSMAKAFRERCKESHPRRRHLAVVPPRACYKSLRKASSTSSGPKTDSSSVSSKSSSSVELFSSPDGPILLLIALYERQSESGSFITEWFTRTKVALTGKPRRDPAPTLRPCRRNRHRPSNSFHRPMACSQRPLRTPNAIARRQSSMAKAFRERCKGSHPRLRHLAAVPPRACYLRKASSTSSGPSTDSSSVSSKSSSSVELFSSPDCTSGSPSPAASSRSGLRAPRSP